MARWFSPGLRTIRVGPPRRLTRGCGRDARRDRLGWFRRLVAARRRPGLPGRHRFPGRGHRAGRDPACGGRHRQAAALLALVVAYPAGRLRAPGSPQPDLPAQCYGRLDVYADGTARAVRQQGDRLDPHLRGCPPGGPDRNLDPEGRLRLAPGDLRPGGRGHAAGFRVLYGDPPETNGRPHAAVEPVRPAGLAAAGLAGAVLNGQAVRSRAGRREPDGYGAGGLMTSVSSNLVIPLVTSGRLP